jgi:hypothetical protein
MILEKGVFEVPSRHGGYKWTKCYLKGDHIPTDKSKATYYIYHEYDENGRWKFSAWGFF